MAGPKNVSFAASVALGTAILLAACGNDSSPPINDDNIATRPLDTAVGRVVGFDHIRLATVIPDGRLAILQPDAVLLVDFDRASTDTIRRDGEGPGEFRRPAALGMGPGGHLTVIDGASRVVSVPVDGRIGTTLMNDSVLPNVYWVKPDTFGTLFLAQYRKGAAKSPASTIDTLLISRLKSTREVDTIGTFAAATFQVVEGSRGTMSLALMFAPIDAWGVTPAGDIWQLRGIDFRPRWWTRETEQWHEGTPRPWTPVRVLPEDRTPLPHNAGYPQLDTILRPATEFKSPFLEAVASPDGDIWARVSQPYGAVSERLVVFPRNGSLTDIAFEAPVGRELVALSTDFVYLVVEEHDGTWTLERYARPSINP